MSDAYQAVYDATRSRIGSCSPADIIREVCHLDASFAIECVRQEFTAAAYEMQRPSAIYRPAIAPDGNQWCALYGANLQEGVAGFGDSPADAMADFDKNWRAALTPEPPQ